MLTIYYTRLNIELLSQFFSKRWKGQLCQSKVHLSEWDANDGDAEYETVEDVGEPYQDAANEEPQHIRVAGNPKCRWQSAYLLANFA